ncbi:MAG: type II toxin-antitoxin system HicB family antitoxin [Patescibacteria group bacterium]|nr:type II toxin-antitoxin system HicB family antitoxin [Patescibacteria group bacterium]MBU2456756.1 type II toxin-antitoxin system HicB family antitoxin [Patescibacteria group bacterium]MBU2474704.1 type II toxin-antitoxin system HicB family antitoxin [Patescibacteria group bacterium]
MQNKIINKINFTSQIWKENNIFISHNPELKVSSCGNTIKKAKQNLKQAIELFIETTEKMGTLNEILEESGFVKKKENHEQIWKAPELLSFERMNLAF